MRASGYRNPSAGIRRRSTFRTIFLIMALLRSASSLGPVGLGAPGRELHCRRFDGRQESSQRDPTFVTSLPTNGPYCWRVDNRLAVCSRKIVAKRNNDDLPKQSWVCNGKYLKPVGLRFFNRSEF